MSLPTASRKYAAQGRDKGRQAIKKEIAIMKKLVHENVVRLHEVIDDEVGQYIFMVLEYVPGGPIYEPAKFQHAASPPPRTLTSCLHYFDLFCPPPYPPCGSCQTILQCVLALPERFESRLEVDPSIVLWVLPESLT